MHARTSCILVIALAVAACGGEKDVESTSSAGSTTTPDPTTGPDTTGEPTTTSDTTAFGSTAGPDGTTEPGSTTTPDAGTGPGTTTEPGGTTDPDTTGGVGGTDVPYVDCSNDMANPIPCPEGLMCVDPFNTNGTVFGSFCAPECAGDFMECPLPEGASGVYPTCLFGMGMATHCALTCSLADDTCPGGMHCENVGLADGVCTHP